MIYITNTFIDGKEYKVYQGVTGTMYFEEVFQVFFGIKKIVYQNKYAHDVNDYEDSSSHVKRHNDDYCVQYVNQEHK